MISNRKLFIYIVLAVLLVGAGLPLGACSSQPQKDKNMPVILLSDFGTDSYWVPELKGIVYSSNPQAVIIDATHDIPSFDITSAAFILLITARSFPSNVVIVAIVQPGVPTGQRYMALTTKKDQILMVPDNGLATLVIREMGIKSCYRIDNTEFFPAPVDTLFYSEILGRAGGLVAGGIKPERLGPALHAPELFTIHDARLEEGKLTGMAVFVDHFGNCNTNIPRQLVYNAGLRLGDNLSILTPGGELTGKFGSTYSDVPVGKVIAFIDELDTLKLSINMGSFSSTYRTVAGSKIELKKTSP